jgi:hypothetical protein
MGEAIAQGGMLRDGLDLSQYGPGPDCKLPTEFAERRLKSPKSRKGVGDCWVWLPTTALGLGIHRPVTKLLAYLYLEANF